MTVPDTVSHRHAPERQRYEVLEAGTVVGAAHYLDLDLDDRTPAERIFYHTTVDDDRAGEGLGSRLAACALEDTVRAGLTIVALCPFIRAYVRRHPELRPATTAVRPEHLAALSHR